MQLTPLQQAVVAADRTNFLYGPAGAGKTTVLQHRLLHLLQQGEPAYTVLVLVADPEQRAYFSEFIRQAGVGAHTDLKLMYYSQLAREMVQLFWPLVAREAGFASGYQPPTFLAYDLSQLLMWRIITPMTQAGAFANLRRRPQQIVSQLLDTLNRASLNRLNIFEATNRQIETWVGDSDHVRNLGQAQEAALRFRAHCLRNNLLDLSLTVETFNNFVVEHAAFGSYFSERYRHFIVDNVEEQTPAGQAFVERLMNATASAHIGYDADGGYRRFLAADPHGAGRFRSKANRVFEFDSYFTSSAVIEQVATTVDSFLNRRQPPNGQAPDNAAILDVIHTRYRREMIGDLARTLARLIEQQQIAPDEIAVIVPYLDGGLRFTISQALSHAGVPVNLVRRRAAPREEPRVRAWLTWVALAHSDWDVLPSEYDVAEALELSIDRLDPARAALLAAAAYPPHTIALLPADELPTDISERVGDHVIERYERLRRWLEAHANALPLDQFIYRLFTDLLATRSFTPEPDLAAAGVCDWLVGIASRLVQSAQALGLTSPAEVGEAFLTTINKGLITSQPPTMGHPPDPRGVAISTIYGYLLRGKPVRVQVWLDTASTGWWDVPRQPLSNAFVLAASWDPERLWTMNEEIEIRNEMLTRIVYGLTARCKDGIILATSDLDRRGQRQEGPLWRALTARLPQTTA